MNVHIYVFYIYIYKLLTVQKIKKKNICEYFFPKEK